MISIVEVMVNRGPVPNRGIYTRPEYNANALARGKVPVASASTRTPALPSTPNIKQMTGIDFKGMRKDRNVSPLTGTRINATGLALMNRKPTPGTGIMNTLRRQNVK